MALPTPVLLNRQRHLLSLLDALGGRVSNMDFQKLLFLYSQEEVTPPYEFVPYKFGVFSFTSYADRRKLVERGLLSDEENVWALIDIGRRAVGTEAQPAVTRFAQANGRLRGDALVADTYRRFPYYATRSEIARTVLRGAAGALQRIENARRSREAGLLTIGYEGLSLEGYLNRLLQSGVTLLCDVRRNPLSRKYGETVCTADLREDGSWVRMYPVPFRRLNETKQYRKFDWVECRLQRHTADPRPETFRPVDHSELQPVGHLDTKRGWGTGGVSCSRAQRSTIDSML